MATSLRSFIYGTSFPKVAPPGKRAAAPGVSASFWA